MQNTRPDISVVIVTWNGKAFALECLASLEQNKDRATIETIVVDNASTDGTPEAIRQQFPSVTLIETGANLGFAKGNNIGMARSTGRYVCLVNSDVVVPPNCFDEMLSYMETNPDVGLLGPKMLTPSGGIGYSVMRLPTAWNTFCCALGLDSIFKRSRLLGGFMMRGFSYDQTQDVEMLTGWFWMTPRAALEKVGGLDERFFMYGEDIDWCKRFSTEGFRVVYYGGVGALHYGGASSDLAPTRFYVEMRRANLQYYRKHNGRIRQLGYLCAVWSHEIARTFGYGFVYLFRWSKRSVAKYKVLRSLSCMGWLAGLSSVPTK